MSKKDDVKQKVSIPMYFYNIIVPQLGSYYADFPVDFDVRPVACCPLHDEDTPSMRFYEETNTFYCFGCRRGGDTIELHRQFSERQNGSRPTLDESVDFLYNYFIKGNENAKGFKPVTKIIKDEPLSSSLDMAKFSMYTSELAKQISIDYHMPEEQKRIIWKALDAVDILLDKNKINANDATLYIKNVVRDTIV